MAHRDFFIIAPYKYSYLLTYLLTYIKSAEHMTVIHQFGDW